MKYNVGDKVVITKETHGHRFSIGDTVEIIEKTNYNYRAKNESDEVWWIMDDEIDYLPHKSNSKDEIHITTEGRYTHAVKKHNGKVVARAEAKCHEDDKFDFNVGVNLCLKRLGVKEEVKTSVPTTEHLAVGDVVTTDYYSKFGECVVVKVEDEDNAIWVTPLGQDEYTKRIVKNYITKGFVEHETAYYVGLWHTVVKVG